MVPTTLENSKETGKVWVNSLFRIHRKMLYKFEKIKRSTEIYFIFCLAAGLFKIVYTFCGSLHTGNLDKVTFSKKLILKKIRNYIFCLVAVPFKVIYTFVYNKIYNLCL